jgi:hypothetical protein
MEANVRSAVRLRAGDRCEYCRLPQNAAPFNIFHVEHIRALQHGGSSLPENLAYACPACNAKKGPNIATVSETGQLIELFNPRKQSWDDHFALIGFEIIGVTEIGDATVRLLGINDIGRLAMRAQLIEDGLL